MAKRYVRVKRGKGEVTVASQALAERKLYTLDDSAGVQAALAAGDIEEVEATRVLEPAAPQLDELITTDPELAAALALLPTQTSGVGAPSAAAPNGSTYDELDPALQKVGEWLRASGSWIKILGAAPRVRLRRQAAFSLPSQASGSVDIPFDTETQDTGNMWALANPTKIFPDRPGEWFFAASMQFAAIAVTSLRRLVFTHWASDGSFLDSYGELQVAGINSGSVPTRIAIAWPIPISAGDHVRLSTQQATGSALDLFGKLHAVYRGPLT